MNPYNSIFEEPIQKISCFPIFVVAVAAHGYENPMRIYLVHVQALPSRKNSNLDTKSGKNKLLRVSGDSCLFFILI